MCNYCCSEIIVFTSLSVFVLYIYCNQRCMYAPCRAVWGHIIINNNNSRYSIVKGILKIKYIVQRANL